MRKCSTSESYFFNLLIPSPTQNHMSHAENEDQVVLIMEDIRYTSTEAIVGIGIHGNHLVARALLRAHAGDLYAPFQKKRTPTLMIKITYVHDI